MKTWQKRHFRENVDWIIPMIIERGDVKTEDEAYSLFKYMCKHSTREFLPGGSISYRYGYPSDNSS